ncbi:MAG: 50S ribosomal protein L5 [Planctomycetes bacterium]|nr:50S ribosomal protein L5 [Planctomycetota bacterium]
MIQRFGYSSVQAVPKITKIVINSGVSRGEDSEKRLATVLKDMTLIAGQRPVPTKAKRSVAGFRVREGDRVGAKVTLRRARMYEFLDRTIAVAIPRVRDFRGLDPDAFDGCGNYNFGVSEQTVFPEVDIDTAEHFFGMDITIVTTAQTNEEGRALLEFFGVPFRQN